MYLFNSEKGSVVVKDLRFEDKDKDKDKDLRLEDKDKDKDKDLRLEDKDKDKDKDLRLEDKEKDKDKDKLVLEDPRGQGFSSRTRTLEKEQQMGQIK